MPPLAVPLTLLVVDVHVVWAGCARRAPQQGHLGHAQQLGQRPQPGQPVGGAWYQYHWAGGFHWQPPVVIVPFVKVMLIAA